MILALLVALATVPLGAAGESPSPARGDVVPAFDATGLDGRAVRVDYAHGPTTVLLFFLSSCPTCHKMLPEWNRAYDRRPKTLRVYGILLDQEPPGFFMATPVSFPVLRSPGGDFTRAYKLSRVPLTLRIGPGGRVEDVGSGYLDAMRLGELFSP